MIKKKDEKEKEKSHRDQEGRSKHSCISDGMISYIEKILRNSLKMFKLKQLSKVSELKINI